MVNKMKKCAFFLAAFVSMGTWTTANAEGWITYPTIISNSGKFPEVAQWVNESRKPNSIGDIVVLYGQLGRNADYSVQVFCKQGQGQLGKVISANYPFNQGTFDQSDFTNAVLAGQQIVVLLQFAGQRNAIFYLKRVGN
jgi:hypothetical protein